MFSIAPSPRSDAGVASATRRRVSSFRRNYLGPGGIIWGLGPVIFYPTATDDLLGGEKWGLGPTLVLLKQDRGWTFGVLANQIWSIAGNDNRQNISATFLQPFVNYTTKTHTTFGVDTESTYDWETQPVDGADQFDGQPNPEDWETADQYPARRPLLCGRPERRPGLGRASQLHAALSRAQTPYRAASPSGLCKIMAKQWRSLKRMKSLQCILTPLAIVIASFTTTYAQDPLPSWNDTASKKAIVAFVEKVTKEGSPDFVPPASASPP